MEVHKVLCLPHPATKSAHGGSQSAAPATTSAHGGSQSPVPGTKSAHGGSQSAAPATKSAHGGSRSAAPATKSAIQETSENFSNPNGRTIPTMPEHDPSMTRDRLAPVVPQTLTCQLRSHRFHRKIQHFVRSLSLHNAFCIPPATKSAHGGAESAVPATKSAHGGSQSAAPATKSAHGGSKSPVPATKSAHGGSHSAAPATQSAPGAGVAWSLSC